MPPLTKVEGGQLQPLLGSATFDEKKVSLFVNYEKDEGELLSSGTD
jgi:hypothetical protein